MPQGPPEEERMKRTEEREAAERIRVEDQKLRHQRRCREAEQLDRELTREGTASLSEGASSQGPSFV